ncbi:MAG: NAD(P)/FAD-dependent oxidoreductase [Phycisphaerales bacterium]|nr:NAD(P)/FAD-dependent oxidoreductase [Phycisphaerales bacterium]MCI0674341.1 NAD(P)/FAD-dependent oxidoreductase [Phycisphaerales bacterium]
MQSQRPPHVVILGGGFGGLYAAKKLRKAPVHITLFDSRNHHLFQPLLYEVATAALSPADIAAPIRKVLSKQKNTTVLLGQAASIDTANRVVHLVDDVIHYDYLIVATGATHSYFGHEQDWSKFAPGLKTVDDALEIRRRFLLAFEAAEREADPDARRAKLTFIVVGGGPTGVEMAGTMSELARRSIPKDFRAIDTTTARVILLEGGDRLLQAYPPKLAARAKRDLAKLGAEVRLNSFVTEIDAQGVKVGQDRIEAENVIWAAGVQASSLGATLGVPIDRTGRVQVLPDLSIPGHPEVFVIGDLAKSVDPKTGKEVPGVAPAAIQMGKYVASMIAREARGTQSSTQRQPFHYVDKGMLATIGRARAVASIKGFNFAGPFAWLLWALIHILQLIGFRNRLIVMLQWAWAYIIFQRGARLITGNSHLELRRSRTDESDLPPASVRPLPQPRAAPAEPARRY